MTLPFLSLFLSPQIRFLTPSFGFWDPVLAGFPSLLGDTGNERGQVPSEARECGQHSDVLNLRVPASGLGSE